MKLDVKSAIILAAMLVLAAVGSAYITSWVFSNRTLSPALHDSLEEQAVPFVGDFFDPQLTWYAGTFTVNLARSGNFTPYMKTDLVFQLSDQRTVKVLERRKPQVRDRIITTLRTITLQEIQDDEGINTLKHRIIEGLNELLRDESGHVRDVYFTDLVIQ